ncbi:SDR family NAD(P)-dependent oxidoreductase [Paenibacillus paeoniae]|uniref:SDR family NAD(P)-dependent oxidoreductase n=1 Tax=Paenibacillus paeoniae TaxID=2292705 RepID=A0A371P6G8_9BACL|nr:glucose 1-dehydrogenase [Paenibacillus paeoniae]REK71543.1 SDR family NAD(P)-dependent oxidoreductase [Paenibacillus paeoniae]
MIGSKRDDAVFTGKVVLVTGAGAGIGQALALAYARSGATVAIADRNEGGLAETSAQLEGEGYAAISITADLSLSDDISRMFERMEEQTGGIDILINNAGFGIWKSPYDLELDEWDCVLNTNLRGTFLCSREAAKGMKKRGGGSIVNLSSTRALMSEANSEAYAASKAGILGLTHAMAVSLGPDRIRVNAICPGWIDTGDYSALRTEDHVQHPAGRVGKPEDITKACFYLSDPHNDFVTGIHLTVDGGMTRRMIYEE